VAATGFGGSILAVVLAKASRSDRVASAAGGWGSNAASARVAATGNRSLLAASFETGF